MMSKTALKKLQKKREADAKKAAKKKEQEAKAAAAPAKKKSALASAEADDQLEPHQSGRRADRPSMNRGGAAAGTRIVRGDESPHPPTFAEASRGGVAAGNSAATSRGGGAAGTWIYQRRRVAAVHSRDRL